MSLDACPTRSLVGLYRLCSETGPSGDGGVSVAGLRWVRSLLIARYPGYMHALCHG